MNVFKKIYVGGISKDTLLNHLVDAGIQFNAYAKTLFDNPSFIPDGPIEKLSLVKLSPSELEIQNPYSLEMVINGASRLGLKPCPLYLAAFLRLEYMDQPEGPYLTVASPRLSINDNYPTGFYIRNYEGCFWLRGYRAIGECDHPIDNEFIFIK